MHRGLCTNLYEYLLLEVTGGIASIDILKQAEAYYDTISFLKNWKKKIDWISIMFN